MKLVALFSPEHGIRGELDEKVGDGKDAKTGLPVYSLYGEAHASPTPSTLKGIDTLVYDIQDIGCRFYTYISTLGLVLEAAEEHKVKVVVLDRPNPIGGALVEGPVRDAGRGSFVAYHDMPIRHGMTVGELATMFNAEKKLARRAGRGQGARAGGGATRCDRTGLAWVNPSPNMRQPDGGAALPRRRPAGDDERERRPGDGAAVRVGRCTRGSTAGSWRPR